jgi:pimeloyl-ACP methyl ester carboxylesterase
MNIVDVGNGAPLVLIPGIQGRWEWMRPAVDVLAKHCRVITFSLADEPTSGARFDESSGIWGYVQQVDDVMDAAGVRTATICGVSFGGLIASSFAARHAAKVSGLVLASAIPPSWRPDARAQFFMRAPRLLSPLFCVGSLRMCPEIFAAKGSWSGAAFAAQHASTVLANMFSPRLMARRAGMVTSLDVERQLADVRCPVLMVTGESALDRVVPVSLTREYRRIWPHATEAVLQRTGHLGLITRPEEFARVVTAFAAQNANRTSTGRCTSGGIGAG